MHASTPVNSVLRAIGNTPVVKLNRIVPSGSADVYLKLEFFNPTGSYKDRMAVAMIEGAERRGTLKPGMRVTEFTGGSTGSSLAMVCAVKGYPFTPVSSNAFAEEKLRTMGTFGGDLQIVQSPGGMVTPQLFKDMTAKIQELTKDPKVFWTDQFHNEDAIEGYKGIGRELLEQLPDLDVYCAAVGTGGHVAGVSRALKEGGSKARIVALEPASSPAITQGKGGPHRVEGIGVGYVPPHLKREDFDEARTVEESEAREIARRLAREEGILVGTSSGMNVAGALKIAAELGPGKKVVTVAVDTGLKYLAGDLFAS